MRFSKSFIKTLKETPKEAETASHKLLLRASMIKKLTSGVYTYLPLGYKALKKVENIVREEMDRAGAQEILMPVLQPAELWKESGRWEVMGPLMMKLQDRNKRDLREEMDRAGAQEILMPVLQPAELWKESGRWEVMGPLMMKLQDRNKRDFVLGPTHEEVITDLIRNEISSYKSLPLNLYQIQTKFRDEIRPRFGLMRGREFVMKDAYSFHTSQESLDEEFLNMRDAYSRIFSRCGLKFRPVEADSGEFVMKDAYSFHTSQESLDEEFLNMRDAYSRIFSRCGLKFRPVEADSGAIGGSGSQEFHVLADSGEDEIIYCDSCEYAANVETATSKVEPAPVEELKAAELIDTPNVSKIDDIVNYLNIPYSKTVKAMMYRDMGTDQVYMVLIRGDYEVNETKLRNVINAVDVALLTDEELEKHGLIKGFIGPYGNEIKDIKVLADEEVTKINNHTAGGNKLDTHYINVNYGRDYTADIVADVKTVKPGETCPRCGGNKNQ